MFLRIPVGKEDFDTIRREGSYYIDKSELIFELLQETDNAITLFTRPRRFGKTLNMSMMRSFLDITRDSRDVFEDLIVYQNKEFCNKWLNSCPVISISLKGIEGPDFDSAFELLKGKISDICIELSYLLTSDMTDPDDKAVFSRLKSGNASKTDIQRSLKVLTRMMNFHFDRQAVLLIDEYDVPLAKSQDNGYYKEMLSIIRSMFDEALKTNDYLKFAVITGCLRISKESVFTGVNNFKTYSVMDNRFARYFGFTDDEVNRLLETAGLTDHADTVREWYDGYLIGDCNVYCPWDVINYVADNLVANSQPGNYWKNSSDNSIIRSFVDHSEFGVNDKFEALLNGSVINAKCTDELTYDQLYDSEDNLWSVLLMTGYVTRVSMRNGVSQLRIPNREIATIFEDTVVRWFQDTLDSSEQRALFNAMWNGDADSATEIISELLWHTISFYDYHEDFYHAFITGVFAGAGYETESNREHGLGRTDIIVKDRSHRRCMVIEAKKSASEESMEADCHEAICQIYSKKYADDLYGYNTIHKYGISFFQKSALVRIG